MGIHGLWPLIEETGTNITLDALEGKRLAIDVSFWIYQAQNNDKLHSRNPYITLLINRIAKLLYYKVRPIFVFDGEEIPVFKQQILRDRVINRQLGEMTWNKAQRSEFKRLAKDHLKCAHEKQSFEGKCSTSGSVIGCSLAMPSTSTECDRISIGSDESSDSDAFDLLCGNESIDKRIALVESVREHKRNSRLQPEEMPVNSKQFSLFQLERLIERNKINLKLEKLKKDKIWKNIRRPLDDHMEKVIVSDKQKRLHVFTRTYDVQDEKKTQDRTNFDWLHYVKAQIECNSRKKSVNSRNEILSVAGSHSSDDNEFIDVSDCDNNRNTNNMSEITTYQQHLSDIECGDEALEENGLERDGDEDKETHFQTQKSHNFTLKTKEEDIYADCRVFFRLHNFKFLDLMLLTLLGIPFMQAPAEAEAQCVELERLGLVDGIVTDDSDVWLFGGQNVYRHMFSRKKHLQKYCAEEINRRLGLRRAELVQLGMLAGGDYSHGLAKIGIVTALELVSEFVEQKPLIDDEIQRAFFSLKCISRWLLSRANESSTRRLRLKRAIETNNNRETIDQFPNVEVFEMYAKPRVDSLNHSFCWDCTDFEKLENFLRSKLGLTLLSFNNLTFGAFEKWNAFIGKNKQNYQMRITDFAKSDDSFKGILGLNPKLAKRKRVHQALGAIKDSKVITKKEQKQMKPKKRRGKMTAKHLKKSCKKSSKFAEELNLSEESSDG